MAAVNKTANRTHSLSSTGDVVDVGFRSARSFLLPTSPRRATTPNRTGPPASRSKEKTPLKRLGDVIEISSDEDEPPPQPRSSTISELRKEVERLTEEQATYKQKLEKSQLELAQAKQQLQAPPKPDKDQVILSFSQLEDSISCDVCSSRMWQPHILPDCGHTFCQSCLQDWFSHTLAQYMQAHPHYNATYNRRHTPYANSWGVAWGAPAPNQGPQYTCPSCRKTVTNRPVEDFTLKSLVRTLAGATGESSPKKPQEGRTRGKTRGTALKTNNPWEGFFPTAPPNNHIYNMI